MARKARWAAAAAAGAVAAGASLWMLTPAAATGPVNPVEGGLGFLVLVEGNATLTGTESEGPVAVGGDLTFGGGYRIATERSVRLGDGDSPLVIGGRALLGAPPVVDATVLDGGRGAGGADTDGLGAAAGKDDGPGVLLRAADPPRGSGSGARKANLAKQEALDFSDVFATFRERSQQFDTCAETATLRTSDGRELPRPIETAGTKAYVSLTPGQTNVLNLTGDEFNNLSDLTFNTQPGAATPLLVNVRSGGSYEWRTANFAGVSDNQAPYILMNFPDATAITQVGADTAEGTIYAPNADFTDVNTANNEGNLVVKSYTHGTAATDGGETHDLPFNTTIHCGAAAAGTPGTAPPATSPVTETSAETPVAAMTEPATAPSETMAPETMAPETTAPETTAPGTMAVEPAATRTPEPVSTGVPGVEAPPMWPSPTDAGPAPLDSGLPWAWMNEPAAPVFEPTDPPTDPPAGDPSATAVSEEPPPADAGAELPGDAAADDDTIQFWPSTESASPSVSPSATPAASPSGSGPAVVANYGPLPGQGGAGSGQPVSTAPPTARLLIAALSILVVSGTLMLLGRRRRRRHLAAR
ncbi:collagen-binding domain-containing protein [Asanoa sp. NPDC049573]|uniref:collagen-binding domain-containing protein n=1 Tax=Asanoa sp. NPDC049573 TaxID=3155396 RepID=UPI00341FF9BF